MLLYWYIKLEREQDTSVVLTRISANSNGVPGEKAESNCAETLATRLGRHLTMSSSGDNAVSSREGSAMTALCNTNVWCVWGWP